MSMDRRLAKVSVRSSNGAGIALVFQHKDAQPPPSLSETNASQREVQIQWIQEKKPQRTDTDLFNGNA